jgi:fumarate reductase flavoprotein subunit
VTLQRLEANLRERGGRLERGARAAGLRRDAARGIWSVEADVDGRRVLYEVRQVVIADGGFQSNIEMLGANIAPAPDEILQRGAATGKGDGLMMAKDVGARITELTCFYGHLLSRDAPGNPRLWPRPYFDVLVECGIVVDDRGERIADEGLGGIYMANMVARMAAPRTTSVVFDHDGWTGPGAHALIPTNPHLVNEGGTLHKADSIAGLARLMGVPEAALGTTIDAYNAALRNGNVEALVPPRSEHKAKPLPIVKAPFYAIPMCTGITYTMGGIAIDGHSRVLDRDDRPIEDLFAIGCCTGGLEGGPAVGYVGGLTKSAVTSVRAAEYIREAVAA